jgi:uncharacterized protein DUF4190
MTAPGGSFGEDSGSAPSPPAAGEQSPAQPISDAPWASPASPSVVDYPTDPGYPAPGYPTYPDSSAGYRPPVYPQYPQYPPPPPMPSPYGGYSPGYPGWDYAGGYGAHRSGTNTMAITSLIAGILGVFCCIGSIVGIVCGSVGLNQIKQTREEGYGMAVGGIVISVATLLLYFVVVLFGMVGA